MRTFRIFLMMVVLLLICQPAFSQSHDSVAAKKSKSDLMLKSGRYKPFLEFAYGFSTPKYEGIDASFAQLGMADFKVGYSSDDSLKYNLISSDQHFAFVSFLNDNLSSSGGAEVDEIGSEMTRFGFGNRRAYGYGGSGLKIEMYNQDGLDWTKVSPTSYETMDEDVQDMFDHFGSTYRFGMLTEAGLRVKVTQSFSLIGGAEGGVVMPRTVFWPWLGSVAIYSVVQGGLEKFSANIIEASPTAGPVIAFLLKTGASAGYYYLLRDDMNWPFGYEAPLTVSSFKVGANFTF